MEWRERDFSVSVKAIVPSSKNFQNKYFMGKKLLLYYNNTLFRTRDHNYSRFLELYEKVEQSTLLDFDRAFILFQAAQATKHLKGCTVECGVYKGGSSVLIAMVSTERKHYALDTFSGFPDVISEVDVHEKAGFSDVSVSEIEELFCDYRNIVMLEGKFSESFKKIHDEVFSFVYVDADLYISTIECCKFFYPRLFKGGIILFDDYLVPDTPGVKKAVDEFFLAKDEVPIVLPTCQAMVFKV